VIVGIGLNVCSAQADLPIPTATSMRIEAERFAGESREALEWDRASLLVACLSQWQSLWSGFVAAGGDATASGLAQDYQALCATIGQQVRADVAGADPVVGTAASIDGQGHLVIESDMHRTAVAAADIRHLR
jgi:BirA family biotin operon repressor/biotin-[acetyl-CoA-carboxylase] ligase